MVDYHFSVIQPFHYSVKEAYHQQQRFFINFYKREIIAKLFIQTSRTAQQRQLDMHTMIIFLLFPSIYFFYFFIFFHFLEFFFKYCSVQFDKTYILVHILTLMEAHPMKSFALGKIRFQSPIRSFLSPNFPIVKITNKTFSLRTLCKLRNLFPV